MRSNFTVCMLTQGSGSAPEFLVSEVNLQPGRQCVPHSLDTITLASGFSSVSPDTAFPLSPTLQLNQDVSKRSSEDLHRLALAETERIRSTTYRSYSVDPDPRICVISSKTEALNTFIDTYGGILEIEPILIRGSDKEIPTATELAIFNDKNGYRLEYSVRVPVNSERCTYCGACGPACPESCLDEQLFIDYSRCTFCKECEKACVHEAIDVYGAEQRIMRIPAILVLDATDVELPENRSRIYAESDLPTYFASLFASQVDEVIVCDSSLCQYHGKLGYGCRICSDACQYGAVSRSGSGIIIDSLKCEECGGCVASCPTGAMQYQRCDDSAFIKYIEDIQITPGTTIVLANEKVLHKLWWSQPAQDFGNVLFLEYNQIKALSLFHLLYLYVSGAGRIVLLSHDDVQTDMAPLQRQVALTCSLLNTFCQVANPAMIMTLADFLEDTVEAAAPSVPVLAGNLSGNRRENLAKILQYLSEKSGRQARIKGHDSLPFATIFCDPDKCTQCYACLNTCRIQALSTNEAQLALLSLSSLCIGCGVCVRVCPENALQMVRGATLDAKFFHRELLAETEPMACKKCGKVFGSKKSFERVMAILAQKESVNTEHFEYCETCRVVNLFENV